MKPSNSHNTSFKTAMPQSHGSLPRYEQAQSQTQIPKYNDVTSSRAGGANNKDPLSAYFPSRQSESKANNIG